MQHDVENGRRSSPSIEAWLKMADILDLNPKAFLERVWRHRGRLEIALPSSGDPRSESLLEVACEQGHLEAESRG
jgi:hypothetical protein